MKKSGNLVVAQSGGPSAVINNTVRGVIEVARDLAEIGTVYGARHGIEGILKEELLNLTAQTSEQVNLLRNTPAAGSIGTCRYKLKSGQDEDFARCINVFKAHHIEYFVYIGGNDSMDTASKIAQLAHQSGLDLIVVGGPKTIDNDVGDSEFKLIDHTPGYGSAAKYWMHTVQNANEENKGSCPADPVLVMQAMGRKIGFIPAAARLADPCREMPLQIYLAEKPCTLEQLTDNVNDQLKHDGRCMVVISEGFDVGSLGEVSDAFGHTSYGSSQVTVAQRIVNHLNQVGLAVKGAARANVPGTDQRTASAYASPVDLDEAYEVGQKAGLLAAAGESGFMATILRKEGRGYNVSYDKVPLDDMANSERKFPCHWISQDGTDVTDDFIDYAKPLIGNDMVHLPMADGRQRMTQFEPIYADQKLPAFVPQAERD